MQKHSVATCSYSLSCQAQSLQAQQWVANHNAARLSYADIKVFELPPVQQLRHELNGWGVNTAAWLSADCRGVLQT